MRISPDDRTSPFAAFGAELRAARHDRILRTRRRQRARILTLALATALVLAATALVASVWTYLYPIVTFSGSPGGSGTRIQTSSSPPSAAPGERP